MFICLPLVDSYSYNGLFLSMLGTYFVSFDRLYDMYVPPKESLQFNLSSCSLFRIILRPEMF